MNPFDRRCPNCLHAKVWRSRGGVVGLIARLLLLAPLRCAHCNHRFWRVCLVPPPRSPKPRRRSEGKPYQNMPLIRDTAPAPTPPPAPAEPAAVAPPDPEPAPLPPPPPPTPAAPPVPAQVVVTGASNTPAVITTTLPPYGGRFGSA